MGKIFWLIVIIIMAVALHGAFTGLKGGVKFENLSAIFKLPSGLRITTTTVNVSVGVGGKNYANGDKPISVSPSNHCRNRLLYRLSVSISVSFLSHYGQVELTSFSLGNSINPSRL